MDTQLLRYLCVRILEREELTKQCKKKKTRTGVASDLGGETTWEYHDEYTVINLIRILLGFPGKARL